MAPQNKWVQLQNSKQTGKVNGTVEHISQVTTGKNSETVEQIGQATAGKIE